MKLPSWFGDHSSGRVEAPGRLRALLAVLALAVGLVPALVPVARAGVGWPNLDLQIPYSTYHALTPARLLDTRNGTGLAGPSSSHAARTFQVTGGVVPASATAVTGNLTVTAQTSPGYLFLGPLATNNPTSSTLNFPLGDDRANGVTVALGSGGILGVTFVASAGAASAHVIFDVTGYFEPDASGATYVPLTPARLLDTRNNTGLAGPSGSHAARPFQVTGGVVPANATAVTGNLTVTGQTSPGYLFLGPVATNDPTSSTLNFPVGDDRANGVTVALGSGGILGVTFVASAGAASAQVIFDVTGYFVPNMSGASYVPLNPARVLDTRNGTGLAGPSGSHSARSFAVAGAGGVPPNATAVTGNLTVTGQTSPGYLFLGPVATNNPTSSTLNFPLGDDRADGVTLALGSGGELLGLTLVSPDLSAKAQAIFDVTGYFVLDSSGGPRSYAGMSLYRYSAWSHQATNTWCIGASTQMMLNIVTGASDHSSTTQSAYMSYAFSHSQYVARVGAEVDGWANALTHVGLGAYSVAGYGTSYEAIKAAATRMRVTGAPVGLVVMEGHHAWVMAGFTSVGEDPSVSQNFAVTSVIVMASYYGSSAYDPAPGSVESLDYMAAKLTPYTDDFPTIWDGQYVIIQP